MISKIKVFNHSPFVPITVDDKLIRGRAIHKSKELKILIDAGVNQIIDLRSPNFGKAEILPRIYEKFMCKIFGIKYKNFRYSRMLETMPDMDFFEQINEKIVNNEGKTYIHCRNGRRRTGVCVAIYEKLYSNKSKNEILNEIYEIGFKENHQRINKISKKHFNRIVNIYNNFLEKFYPDEPRIH